MKKNKKAYSDSAEEEEYNSDEGDVEKRNKGFTSFTMKKSSLLEEPDNKLISKKEKKKAAQLAASLEAGDEAP